MKLTDIGRDQTAIIKHIPEGMIRAQTYRLGLSPGESIRCLESLPGGPVVVEREFQEIALGRNIAESIIVDA
jgi:ferrous iron transport protein A